MLSTLISCRFIFYAFSGKNSMPWNDENRILKFECPRFQIVLIVQRRNMGSVMRMRGGGIFEGHQSYLINKMRIKKPPPQSEGDIWKEFYYHSFSSFPRLLSFSLCFPLYRGGGVPLETLCLSTGHNIIQNFKPCFISESTSITSSKKYPSHLSFFQSPPSSPRHLLLLTSPSISSYLGGCLPGSHSWHTGLDFYQGWD